MSNSLHQLGHSFARLSSLERRFIIGVAVILFVVVNLVFVLPHADDLAASRQRRQRAETKLRDYDRQIAQTPMLTREIEQLGSEAATVPPEDQAINFLTTIRNQAVQSGITIDVQNRQPERTNQFFVERAQQLNTHSGEEQLVDFLYSLGAGNSLIRARGLTIRTDPPRQTLIATMTLVASYQKKASTRAPAAAAPASHSTPVAKPANPATAPAPAPKPGHPAVPSRTTNPATPTKK